MFCFEQTYFIYESRRTLIQSADVLPTKQQFESRQVRSKISRSSFRKELKEFFEGKEMRVDARDV